MLHIQEMFPQRSVLAHFILGLLFPVAPFSRFQKIVICELSAVSVLLE